MIGRIRTIKPEALTDEKLWDLEESTGLPLFRAFVGLWMQADREGRFEWRHRPLKAAILPYWPGDFTACLDALARAGFIVRYEVGGKALGFVRTFLDHQQINGREQPSRLPPPPAVIAPYDASPDPSSTRGSRVEHASRDVTPGELNGTERNGTEQNGTRVADAAAPRTSAQIEDSAKVLGLARASMPRLALVQAMATAYSERVKTLTGRPWMGASAIEAIGRGAPALANRKAAEHLDSLAAWAESDPDPLALFMRVLDGAVADEWVASKGLPLGSLAENPARWVSAIKAASKDGPQPPSDASKFRPMSREERRARMTGGAS